MNRDQETILKSQEQKEEMPDWNPWHLDKLNVLELIGYIFLKCFALVQSEVSNFHSFIFLV